jgi:hypothetical protein
MAVTRFLLDTGAMGDLINHHRNVDVSLRSHAGYRQLATSDYLPAFLLTLPIRSLK